MLPANEDIEMSDPNPEKSESLPDFFDSFPIFPGKEFSLMSGNDYWRLVLWASIRQPLLYSQFQPKVFRPFIPTLSSLYLLLFLSLRNSRLQLDDKLAPSFFIILPHFPQVSDSSQLTVEFEHIFAYLDESAQLQPQNGPPKR